ncbi:MAG: hypothetical protein ACLQGT_16310, partial [Terracidiphilus sp.]
EAPGEAMRLNRRNFHLPASITRLADKTKRFGNPRHAEYHLPLPGSTGPEEEWTVFGIGSDAMNCSAD